LNKIKIFLDEKEIERVGHLVARHTSALNLYLKVIERYSFRPKPVLFCGRVGYLVTG
jgi:hypothetical protein